MTDNENICNDLWITGFQAFYLEMESPLIRWLVDHYHENSSARSDTYVIEYSAVGVTQEILTTQANANHPSAS